MSFRVLFFLTEKPCDRLPRKRTLRAISTAPVGAEASAPEERSSAADAPAASASSDRSSTAATGRIFISGRGVEVEREKGKRETRRK